MSGETRVRGGVIQANFEALEAVGSLFEGHAIQTIVFQLAEMARHKWVRLAQSGLNTSRAAYINGISEIDLGEDHALIQLRGALAGMIESGASKYDLRDALLSGEGVKRDKKGRKYRVISFEHTTPGSGYQKGRAMDRMFESRGSMSRSRMRPSEHAGAIGSMAYEGAKSLRSGESLSTAGLFPKLHHSHAHDPFDGMMKQGRNYRTFRTISEKNWPKWLHPGIEARNFASQVGDHVEQNAARAVDAYLKAALSGMK